MHPRRAPVSRFRMTGQRLALALAAALTSAVLTAAPQTPKPEEDGVPRFTVAEVQQALAKDDAVLIDVRGDVPYSLEHIRGAISIPLGLIKARITDIPKGKLVVAYCACKRDDMSVDAVLRLNEAGIQRAVALKDGIDAWKRAGLPVEVAPPEDADTAARFAPAADRGRIGPPAAVTCNRNDVTSYNGRVTRFRRTKTKTTIRIATEWATTETVTATKPLYLLNGEAMKPADWKRAGVGEGGRANVWVCRAPGFEPVIDWRVAE